MVRDADAEIAGLAEQGIVLDPVTEASYREILAAENAAVPVKVAAQDHATPAPSKSTAKRVAAQKKSPRKRRS